MFWSDPSGLFETEAAARMFAKENDINDYMITSDGKGRYILTITAGEQFYEMEVLDNRNDEGGGGSDSSSGDTFLGFSPSEIGTLATAGSVFANGLEGRAQDNANYKYKYGSKTHTAQQLTELNKARMNSIAKGANALGRAVGITGATIAVYDAFENPTTANIIKASVNVGLLFVRMNPVTGVILGISDLSGFSDYIYNGVGNMIDNY